LFLIKGHTQISYSTFITLISKSGLGCAQLQKGLPGFRKAVILLGIGRAAVLFFGSSGNKGRRSIRALWASVVGKFLVACLGKFLAR